MIDEIVYRLPKGVKLSQHLREGAMGYLRVAYLGNDYYLPITKNAKKIFGFKIIKGKIEQRDWETNTKMADFARDVVGAMFLQVRESVGDEIHSSLSQDIAEGFSKLAEKGLERIINYRINKRLPAPKKERQVKHET